MPGEGRKAIQYVDMKNQKQDKEMSKIINELREVKVVEKMEKANCKSYEVDWVAVAGLR